MKAILINIVDRTVTEHETIGTLQEWYRLIDCDQVQVGCYLNSYGDLLLVDEEGKFKNNPPHWFTYEGCPYNLYSNGLVVGVSKDGDTISPAVSFEEVKFAVKFHSR